MYNFKNFIQYIIKNKQRAKLSVKNSLALCFFCRENSMTNITTIENFHKYSQRLNKYQKIQKIFRKVLSIPQNEFNRSVISNSANQLKSSENIVFCVNIKTVAVKTLQKNIFQNFINIFIKIFATIL